MEAIAELIIGSVVKAVKDHALANAQEQAEIEANMVAAARVMVGDRAETGDAHDKRLAETLAAIVKARTEEDTKP